MAEDDIIQRIIIEAVDKASAVANSLAQTVSGVADKIKSSFAGAAGADAITESFARATQSISALGSTATEALNAAAQAAQKFGASAQELQKVEGAINALNARARDSSTAFSTLATNYDAARGTLAGVSPALGQAGQAAERAGQGAKTATGHITGLHREMAALLGVVSLIGGGPLASAAATIGSVGIAFGAAAAGVAALVVALGAATAASVSLGTLVEGLKKLADASGSTVEAASRIQQAMSRLGVSPQDFIQSMTRLQQRVASAMPGIRDEIAGAADKIAAAFDKVATAQINIERIPLKAEQLNQQQQSLALQLQALDFRRQELALQGQQLVLGARQIGLQQQQIVSQLRDLPQLQQFQQRSVQLNVQDAEARLRMLQLQRQLRDGTITQEEFEQRMAAEEDAALNRAIKRAELDVRQARAERAGLSEKQSFEQQSLELQQQQLKLAQEQNALQQAQQPLRSSELDLQEKQIRLQQQMLELDRRQQEIDARQAQRDLREAERERDKAVANDIRNAIREMTAALKEGREPKFGPDVTDETKLKAFYAAWAALNKETGGDLVALGKTLESFFKTDFGKSAAGQNLADQLGVTKIADAFRSSKESLDSILTTIEGLSEKQIAAAEKVTAAYNNMTGAANAFQQKLGAINSDAAVVQLNALATAADKATTSLGKLGKGGSEGISKFLSDLAKNMLGPIPQLLKLLELFSVSKAGAAEAPGGEQAGLHQFDGIKESAMQAKTAVDNLKQSIAETFSQTDLTGVFTNMVNAATGAAEQIAQAFSGLGDRIRQAIGDAGSGNLFDGLVHQAEEAARSIAQSFEGLSSKILAAISGGAGGGGGEAASTDQSGGGGGKAASTDQSGGGGGNLFISFVVQATQAVELIVQAFAGVGDKIAAAFAAVGDRAAEAFGKAITAAQEAANQINSAFQSIDISEPLTSQIDALIQKFEELIDVANRAANAVRRVGGGSVGGGGGGGGRGGGGGGGGPGIGQESFVPIAALAGVMSGDRIIAPSLVAAADGGLFRGRSGIDTNLAWLTDGEFIIRAAAVQRYGVGLLNLINSMQFTGFHMGGMVLPRAMPVPAFAAGGLNRGGGQRTLNLTIGGETFRGLSAPEHVAQQLERAAISRQTSSTGIKPRWSR